MLRYPQAIAIAAWTALVCGCAAERDALPASVFIRLTGANLANDRVTASTQGRDIVLDVHSGSGIGKAEISVKNKEWHDPLVVRLHLHGLEMLSVSNGEFSIRTSVPSHPPYDSLVELVPTGAGQTPLGVTAASAYWMPVRIENRIDPGRREIPLEDGYFEVRVPAVLLSDSPDTVSIEWIDFFRN
jgi:hypothetical protein